MDKLDIRRELLYIEKFHFIMESVIRRTTAPLRTKSRVSDAFVCVCEGSCTYRFDDGSEFFAKSGDCFFLAYNSAYSMSVKDERYVVLYFNFDFIDKTPKRSVLFSGAGGEGMRELFLKMRGVYKKNPDTSHLLCTSLAYTIYDSLIKNESRNYVARGVRDRVAYAKRYIDDNFSSPELNVASLASMAKMSEVYFRKTFSAIYGKSPNLYISEVRIRRAKQLLLASQFIKVETCAAECGFSGTQYFIRKFKAQTGYTPKQYMKYGKRD